MTYQTDCTLPDELLEQIADQGLDILAELIRTTVNSAMQIERQQFLNIGPYERSPERRGQANGREDKNGRRLGQPGLLHGRLSQRQPQIPTVAAVAVMFRARSH